MGVLRPPILPLSILQDVQNRKPLDHQENCPEEHDVCYSPNIGSEVYKIIQMLSVAHVRRDVNGERGGLDVDRISAVFVGCVNQPLWVAWGFTNDSLLDVYDKQDRSAVHDSCL